MAYELFLVRFRRFKSSRGRKTLIRKLRKAALAIVPPDDPLCEVSRINRDSFRIELRASEATVRPDLVDFQIDDFEPQTVPLIYAIAKQGKFVITSAQGESDTILISSTQLAQSPADLREPKPPVCASARQLAALLGVSPDTKPKRQESRKASQYLWLTKHKDRRLGHGDPYPHLPGLRTTRKESWVYIQAKPNEGPLLLMKRFGRFLSALKKLKLPLPGGGGVGNSDWVLRVPTGETFIPWCVTGYSWRPNSEHLIPGNIEAWMATLRDFARQTERAIGAVEGRFFVLAQSGRYRLAVCKSRRATNEDG